MPDGQSIAIEQSLRVGRVVSVSGSTVRGILSYSPDAAQLAVRTVGSRKPSELPTVFTFGQLSSLAWSSLMLTGPASDTLPSLVTSKL